MGSGVEIMSLTDTHKIIAVYGNSGSFKTATSVNLAKAIAKKDRNLKVAVVGIDTTKPLIPVLFPDSKSEVSLGRLLACENIDQEKIFKQMRSHDNIGFLGYNVGENLQSYAFPTGEKIDDFLMQMRHIFNYTIIDCTSFTMFKPTSKALIGADNVLYLISCDVDGLAFHRSQESILLAEQYNYNNYLRCLTISGKFVQDEAAMQNALVRVDGIIPYCESVPEMWNQGKALTILPDSNYSRTLTAIAVEIMEGGE
jgi:cellulose biosynthesis protein BcsQ